MELGFLSPAGLLAALGIAVPIAVHLLRRRREAVVDFPAVRLLLAARRRSARRLRLRRLLLLLLRCLAVLLLALLVARPVLHAPGAAPAGGGAGATAVILDGSLSMSARDGARTRFEAAVAAAAALAGAADPDERYVLIDAVPPAAGAAPPGWLDREGLLEALGRAAVRPAVADPVAAFAEAYRLLRASGGRRGRIVVLTDLARGGWDRFTLAAVPVFDAAVSVRIVVAGGDPGANRAGILRVAGRGESRIAGDPREVVAEVWNAGPDPVVPLEVSVDGGPPRARLASIPPGTAAEVVVPVALPGGGAHRCELRLPPDDYPADDRRLLGLEAAPPVGVLLVDGEPGSSLARSETFFLREALLPDARAAAPALRVAVAGPEEFAAPGPIGSGVVVLANVRAPGAAAARRLAEHVSAGGGLAIFWGRNCDAGEYRRALPGLMPAPVGPSVEAPAERPWRVGAVDHDAPPFAVFRPPAGGSFATAAFTRRAQIGEPAAPARALARFEDGAPWIVEQPVGRGRVLLVGSTADLEGTDLPTKPVFVPFVQRIVLWLAASLDAAADEETVAGAPRVFAGEASLAGERLAIETPGGGRANASFHPEGGGSRAVFRETGEPGFYRWSRPGREGIFAVNVPGEESDLAALDAEAVGERFRPVRPEVVRLAGAGGGAETLGARSLARPLLLALLLLLVAESLVAGPRPGLRALFSRAEPGPR